MTHWLEAIVGGRGGGCMECMTIATPSSNYVVKHNLAVAILYLLQYFAMNTAYVVGI